MRAGLLHERRGWYLYRTGRPTDALAAYELAVTLVPAAAAERGAGPGRPGPRPRAGAGGPATPRRAPGPRRPIGAGPRGRRPWSTRARRCTCWAWCSPTEGRTDDAVGHLHEAGQIAAELGDLAEVAGRLRPPVAHAGRGRAGRRPGRPRARPSAPRPTGPAGAARRRSWAASAPPRCTSSAAGTRPSGCSATAAGAGRGRRPDGGRPHAGVGRAGRRPGRPRPGPRRAGDGPRLVPPGGRRAAERAAAPGAGRAGRVAGPLRRRPPRGRHRARAAGPHRRPRAGGPHRGRRACGPRPTAPGRRAGAGGRAARAAEAARAARSLVARLEGLAATAAARNAPPSSEAWRRAAHRPGRADARVDGPGDPDAVGGRPWPRGTRSASPTRPPTPGCGWPRRRWPAGDDDDGAARGSWGRGVGRRPARLRARPAGRGHARLARRARVAPASPGAARRPPAAPTPRGPARRDRA